MNIKVIPIAITALMFSALLYVSAEQKRTVFVSGTDSGGGSTASETTGLLIKACPELTVTLDRDKADYIVVRDDTGAGPGRKPQKVTVFNRDHELIFAGSTRSIGGAAKDACQAILGNSKFGQKRK